uniref:Uncharacterized protein n=1 Tax=Glossina morsitans morsitans TaxID=37546 RepID=A0A1B0FFA8_GLOMM
MPGFLYFSAMDEIAEKLSLITVFNVTKDIDDDDDDDDDDGDDADTDKDEDESNDDVDDDGNVNNDDVAMLTQTTYARLEFRCIVKEPIMTPMCQTIIIR